MLADCFDSTAKLEESKAVKSCLWELEAFAKRHYDPQVRDYARVFSQDFYKKTGGMAKAEGFAQIDAY